MHSAERDALRLRTIRVSARTALGKAPTDGVRRAIMARTNQLLTELEDSLRSREDAEGLLEAVRDARREFRG